MSIWTLIADALGALAAKGEGLLALFDRSHTPPEHSVAFTIAVVGLGAKMAKADGRVKPAEVAAFRQVFLIAPEDEAAAARVFNLARQDIAGFDAYARRIAGMFGGRQEVLEDILEGLFHVAVADGSFHTDEESFLRRVAEIFGIGEASFACIAARHVPGREPDPWQVLGVAKDADLPTIRRRWRELVKTHHPDQLIARGLPAETVNLGNARIAAINRAWEALQARPRETEPAR
jgi:DnaJ like chaperone protein